MCIRRTPRPTALHFKAKTALGQLTLEEHKLFENVFVKRLE